MRTWLVTGLLALSLIGVGAVVSGVSQMARDLRELVLNVSHGAMEGVVQSLTTRWRSADGSEHEVLTTRFPGESVDDWVVRHDAAVEAAQRVFPPG